MDNMREKILAEAKKHAEESKKHKSGIEPKLKSGGVTSMDNITQEQADFLMKMLTLLENEK